LTDNQNQETIFPCDILVVGAGPAGSSAAVTAAGSGVRVLVVERRAKIGIPIRCAEYIPAQLLGEMKMAKTCIAQSVAGMKTFLPSGEVKETKAAGFMVYRDQFDQHLAEEAVNAGAQIRLSAAAMGFANGRVKILGEHGDYFGIAPRIIIGADGPHSVVGRWMNSVNLNLIPGIQARVPLQLPMTHTEIYFDENFFGGYGWLFPKNKEANVGLACKKTGANPPALSDLLNRFMDRLAREEKIFPEVLRLFCGWIPAEPVRETVSRNMILAGDAAGQTHPITGAGIAPAVICGKMAGKWAARAILEKDMNLLHGYQEEWTSFFGPTQEKAWNRRTLLENNWERLDDMVKKCWVAFGQYHDQS
jgi:digeranylgeranylglycerophospholipid reductase